MFDKFAIGNTNNAFKNKTHEQSNENNQKICVEHDAPVGWYDSLSPGNSIPE